MNDNKNVSVNNKNGLQMRIIFANINCKQQMLIKLYRMRIINIKLKLLSPRGMWNAKSVLNKITFIIVVVVVIIIIIIIIVIIIIITWFLVDKKDTNLQW